MFNLLLSTLFQAAADPTAAEADKPMMDTIVEMAKLHGPNLIGAIVKDPVQDKAVLEEYLETVLRKRRDYADYYSTMTDLV